MLMADSETLRDIMTYENGVCAVLVELDALRQFKDAKFARGRCTIRDPATMQDYSYFYEVLEFPEVTSQIKVKKQGCVVLKLSLDTAQPDIKKCHSVFTKKQMKNMNWIK